MNPEQETMIYPQQQQQQCPQRRSRPKKPFFSWLLVRFLIEGIVAMILYYVFHLNWYISPPMAHIFHAIAIMAFTYLLGEKTGALLNPTAVIAYMIPSFIAPRCIYACRMGKTPFLVLITGLTYILAHMIGTLAGHFLYYATIFTIPTPPVWSFFWGAFVLTAVTSAIIGVIVLEFTRRVFKPYKMWKSDKVILSLQFEKGYYGIAIGGLYLVFGWITNFFSGGILNPLYGIWPSVFYAVSTANYAWLWVTLFYWGVPLIGAIVAGVIYIIYILWFCPPDNWTRRRGDGNWNTKYHCRDEPTHINAPIQKKFVVKN